MPHREPIEIFTIEIYAIIALGTAGAPPNVHAYRITDMRSDTLKPYDQWLAESYWALSFQAGEFAVLIHILYEGQTPGDRKRTQINETVMQASETYLNVIIDDLIRKERAAQQSDSHAGEN